MADAPVTVKDEGFGEATPFILLARCHVKPENKDKWMEAAKVADAGVRESEPGMLHHTWDVDPEDPLMYVWSEVYANDAALLAHLSNPPLQKFVGEHTEWGEPTASRLRSTARLLRPPRRPSRRQASASSITTRRSGTAAWALSPPSAACRLVQLSMRVRQLTKRQNLAPTKETRTLGSTCTRDCQSHPEHMALRTIRSSPPKSESSSKAQGPRPYQSPPWRHPSYGRVVWAGGGGAPAKN